MKRVWRLNFDADDELAGHAAPSAAVRARLRELEGRVVDLTDGDATLANEPSGAFADFVGFSFCPTPGARASLRAVGARVPPAPPLDVLRRVNHRRFSHELGQHLDDAVFATSYDDAVARLSRAAPSPTGTWVAKRAFAYAGRGRIFVRPERGLAEHDTWLRASFSPGTASGLALEPWLDRTEDHALHGFVTRAGVVTLGHATKQICDPRGAWSGSSREHDLDARELAALTAEAERTAAALVAAGYFGPFGIDAFRYRDAAGRRFCPRVEINARYTMGWAVGMYDRRVDRDEVAVDDEMLG